MSSQALSFIVDADIARSAGLCEHPTSSGSRKLLEGLSKNGHRAFMCPSLRDEWKKHNSLFAKKWLASMIAKKRVIFGQPGREIRDFLLSDVDDCKEKDIALKDCHLVDAALSADRMVASNDSTARKVFCEFSKQKREIRAVCWFNAVTDQDVLTDKLERGGDVPPNYYLTSES